MNSLTKRIVHAVAQGAIAGALSVVFTVAILMATNPTGMFTQTDFVSMLQDVLSALTLTWIVFVFFAIAIAVLGFAIPRLGKRWRTFIAFGAAIVAGGIPVLYGLALSYTDAGIAALLFFGLVYAPFVVGATAAAGCVYGFILPSKRRRRR